MAAPASTVELNNDDGLRAKDIYHTNDSSLTGEEAGESKNAVQVNEQSHDDLSSQEPVKEVFNVEQIDPVLQKKMALVNGAIDEIGMTGFQWKMFFLNGFGYAVDSVSVAFGLLAPWNAIVSILTIGIGYSSWLFANRLRTLPFNRNTDCRVPTFREFLLPPRSVSSWVLQYGASRRILLVESSLSIRVCSLAPSSY